ncbi:MAG: GntR family transcriptional regulator [Bifidobacteriaceae bacterium]|jgi:DNA-binding GntR family transcriptional regulator|nr:GntR family transcriptional regulator [Bifidobacteriaceae bacterium]
MPPSSPGQTTTGGTAASRVDTAYANLRQAILAGQFAFGLHLSENAMAARLGLSRTPVREAFTRLHAERLVERRADGGYYVAAPDLARLEALYELRVTLELRGITRVIDLDISHDRDRLAQVRATWQDLRGTEPPLDGSFIKHDEAYHINLATASGNPALTEALAAVNLQIRAVRSYDFLTADRIEQTIDEHLAIVGQLLDAHTERAAELMASHIGASMNVVRERAQRALIAMLETRRQVDQATLAMPGPIDWADSPAGGGA